MPLSEICLWASVVVVGFGIAFGRSPGHNKKKARAVRDLLASIQIDNTAENTGGEADPSYMVMGNVSAKTLRALGFVLPEAK